MVKLNFKWVEKKYQYATGENLYLNRINVGNYSWNSTQSRGSHDKDKEYIGIINLPSIKTTQIYGKDVEEVKNKIQNLVIGWFEEALKNSEG